MAELPTAMAAALADPRVLYFGAVQITLPDYTIRLLDGAAVLTINGQIFRGRDPIYGVLDTIDGLEDNIGDDATSLKLGLIPPSSAALAALVDPAVQGSEVLIMVGVVDFSTGQPVATPYSAFRGELDVPTVDWDSNDRRLEYTVVSVAERLFQVEEGRRLSSAFHQKVWPGEKGLDYCTDVEIILPWGQKADNTVVFTRSNLPGYAETYNRT